VPHIGDKLDRIRRPQRPQWDLIVLFLLLNAAIFGALGIIYLLYSWLDSLPRR
jgi:hypothetical protein